MKEIVVKHVLVWSAVWLALWGASRVSQAAVTAVVQPAEVFVGEAAQLTITSTVAVPDQARLPDIAGLQWLGGPNVSQQSRWVDGRHSFTGSASYTFRCEREGVFHIAGVEVRVRGERVAVPPVEVTVRQRRFTGRDGKELTMADLLRVEARYARPPDGDVGHAFVGEEVPILVEVHAAETFRPTFNYPTLEVDQAVVRDYSSRNNHSSQFDVGAVSARIERGVRFQVATFRSALTPLAAGTLDVKGRALTRVQLERNRRDLFSDVMPFSRNGTLQTLVFSLPPLVVSPPPPLPADGGAYLGLVGDWQVDFSVSEKRVRVGDPFVVGMRIEGAGGRMGFNAPPFAPPGYRSFEPEVNVPEATGEIVVTWVLIPLSDEAGELALTALTLDPRSGEYVRHAFNATIDILPGDERLAETTAFSANGSQAGSESANRPRAPSLLYIKDQLVADVATPLWRNAFMPVLALYGFGMLFLVAAGVCRVLGVGGLANETVARRRSAVKRRAHLVRSLERAAPESIVEVARCEVVPWLADLWGCPPGITAGELADMARDVDPELAAELRCLEVGGFAPERRENGFSGQRLALAVKRVSSAKSGKRPGKVSGALGMLLVLFATLVPGGCTPTVPERDATFAAGVAAYDEGDYARARELFASLARVDAENSVLLYNRANCLFEEGRPAEALALFERAYLLAPRDSDIRENLNFVRAELGLPIIGSAQSPGELVLRLRDAWRPDEWLLLSAVWFAMGMVWAGVARFKNGTCTMPLLIALLGAACFLGVVRSQTTSRYRPDSQAVAIHLRTTAFTHPSTQAKKAEFAPIYGESLAVVERRDGWCRVRADDGGEAWMPDGHLAIVW